MVRDADLHLAEQIVSIQNDRLRVGRQKLGTFPGGWDANQYCQRKIINTQSGSPHTVVCKIACPIFSLTTFTLICGAIWCEMALCIYQNKLALSRMIDSESSGGNSRASPDARTPINAARERLPILNVALHILRRVKYVLQKIYRKTKKDSAVPYAPGASELSELSRHGRRVD